MHVYAWEHIVSLSTEPLNGCLPNLVGMKCSWPGTCIKMSAQGQIQGEAKEVMGVPFFQKLLFQTRRLQQQTEFITMI